MNKVNKCLIGNRISHNIAPSINISGSGYAAASGFYSGYDYGMGSGAGSFYHFGFGNGGGVSFAFEDSLGYDNKI